MSRLALWAVVFWGLSFIATKAALREIHPFTLLTLRFGIGGFLLLLVQLQRDRGFLKAFSSRDWVWVIFLAIVGISGHTVLQALRLLYTTAFHTGWIVAIMPIFITIAARFYLGETITLRKVGGIVLGFLGIILIISKGSFSSSIFRFSSAFDDILVFIIAIPWAAFTVGGKGFLSRFCPLAVITPIMIVGCLITFPFTLLKWEWDLLFRLSLFGAPCHIDWGILSFERRDSVDHPYGWGDDSPRRLPGDKEVFVPVPLIPVCRKQARPPGDCVVIMLKERFWRDDPQAPPL